MLKGWDELEHESATWCTSATAAGYISALDYLTPIEYVDRDFQQTISSEVA